MKVILNILTHGDELIGLKVAEELKKLKISDDIFQVHIANKEAYEKGIRFIDKDLNRSFPGNPNGCYEEKLATKIFPIIEDADIVFDIHSTTSGLKDAVIVTKLDSKTQKYLDIISPKYVLFMAFSKSNALISNAKVGLAFEYGRENDIKVLNNIVNDIKKVLAHLGLIDNVKLLKRKTKYFKINETVEKPKNFKLMQSIKNFKIVKKGEPYAYLNNKFLKAKKDFYPILFGENNYETIFGFRGIEIKRNFKNN